MYHIRRVEKDVKEFSGKQVHIPIYIMASQVNRQEIEDNILPWTKIKSAFVVP